MSPIPDHLANLRPSFGELVRRAEALLDAARATGSQRILGLAGPPGAGKSTLALAIVETLGTDAVYLPMDGYHLAQAELVRLGSADRKGAPDTFDAAGFVALLRRVRDATDAVVYAPVFERAIEEPITGAIAIRADAAVVVTEGNYLLLDDPPWSGVRPLLDEAWFIDVDPEVRVARLIERHVRFGRGPTEARDWVLRSDEANARLVMSTMTRADLVVREAPSPSVAPRCGHGRARSVRTPSPPSRPG